MAPPLSLVVALLVAGPPMAPARQGDVDCGLRRNDGVECFSVLMTQWGGLTGRQKGC